MPSHRTGDRVPRFDFRAQRNPYQHPNHHAQLAGKESEQLINILEYTTLYHTILHIILFYILYALYYDVLYYTILCYVILRYTMFYYLILYCALTSTHHGPRKNTGRPGPLAEN